MSSNALDLTVKLLSRDPSIRLGAGSKDAEEVKAHPFFAGLHWEDAAQRKLIVPKPGGSSVEGGEGGLKELCEEKGKGEWVENWDFVSSGFE